MKYKDLISVIIPVYNVSNYIKRCIDSVINQTYNNLEIILIDDGSLDDCPKICDEYAKKDKRIKVIHQSNKGLSDARNKGLEIATGDYLTFVDSDDFIANNMYEILLNNLKKYKADLSISKYCYYKENNVPEFSTSLNSIVYKKEEALKILLDSFDKTITNHVWNKLYKRNFFKDIIFPSGKNHEDIAVQYKIISRSKKIVVNDSVLYAYVTRSESIVKTKTEEYIKNRIDLTEIRAGDLLKQNISLKKDIYENLFNCYITSFADIAKTDNINIIYNEYFKEKFNNMKILKKHINLKNQPFKIRIW